MLNIIHYCYTPDTASSNRLLAYIQNIPSNEKVRVFFITPDRLKSKIDINNKSVEVIYCWEHFPLLYRVSKVLLYKVSLIYIASLIDRHIDVIYSYNVPGFLSYFLNKSIKCYSERTEYPEIDNYTSRLIKTSTKKHLDICNSLSGLFVISTKLKEYYLSKGIYKDKVHIINMVVDIHRFPLGHFHPKERYIAYCGTATNNKDGVDKLLKAFSFVVKKYPMIKLLIVGKASDVRDKDTNLDLVRNLGIAENVIFKGQVSSREVVNIISDAEALLLNRPNNIQAQYGFPTKLGEYLMTGRPVVVTSVGDIPLFLNDGINAMIADPMDDSDFARKIIWLLDNPILATQIGERGRSVALKNFNASIEVKKMFDVFKSN